MDKEKSQLKQKRFKEAHPESEWKRKEKQIKREQLMLFHIRRNFISDIKIPESIDQESAIFQRVKDRYLSDVRKHVIVEYN